jgi:hypothetical protein
MALVDWEEKLEVVRNNGLTWIDIQNPTRDMIAKLGEKYSFHELNVEALKLFYHFGPARNRSLREHFVCADDIIAQPSANPWPWNER